MAPQDQQMEDNEQMQPQTGAEQQTGSQPAVDVQAQTDAQHDAWNQGVEELTQSAHDAVGMVGGMLATGVDNAGQVLDALGPVLAALEVVGVVAEILDAVTPKS